ncbi:MAG TPA: hypothetical protein PKC36_12645 [Dietzia sp.]|nr:hypothetical protein [Dietzia sp.]
MPSPILAISPPPGGRAAFVVDVRAYRQSPMGLVAYVVANVGGTPTPLAVPASMLVVVP